MPRYELHQREVFFAYYLEQTKPAPVRAESAYSASPSWRTPALLHDCEYLRTNGKRRVSSTQDGTSHARERQHMGT